MLPIAVDVVLGVVGAYIVLSVWLFFFPTVLHKKKRCAFTTSKVTIAHRGGSAECFENTMSAFRNAVKAGADVLEIGSNLFLFYLIIFDFLKRFLFRCAVDQRQ